MNDQHTTIEHAANNARCRLFAHRWDPTTVDTEPHHYVQHLTCSVCGTGKRLWIDRRTGDVTRSGYQYAKGYQLPPGSGGLDRAGRSALRLRWIDPTTPEVDTD